MHRLFAFSLFAVSAALMVFATPTTPLYAQKAKAKAKERDVEIARAAATAPKGHTVEVWASEPLMANPVSFCFDGKGRAYVAETTRFENGVPDTRKHMYWLEEDIGARTVEDRLKMYEKHGYGKKNNFFKEYDDQIRMVWDSTGSGIADKSSIFSSGYNQLKDGLGAGVLAHQGNVYYTNIPDLYLLKDTKGDNKADHKESLATGFGLRAQFLGHDMHGLRMGPDGRLYFSIGDRGLNVKNKEGKQLYNPDSGAVLRCDMDGKNMELVHVGLRNPQELAFDAYGNLFTYDNNCDSGDRARWVYIVEGGDSGWRCGYQYGDKGGVFHTPAVPQGNRGPWNTEKIWHTQFADQVAYIVPPLLHFGNGPSGITHYPGIGLNEKYNNHFFCCDFTSNPGGSKIWTLNVKPKGASFEVSKPEPFMQNMVPTDCEFGPDGAFYWSDWVGGWSPPGKGRIFRVTDPEAMKNPAVHEAKEMFATGFTKMKPAELAKLLDHPHQQIRLEAQWELATRPEAQELFTVAAKSAKTTFGRFHGIWGLGQLNRTSNSARIVLLNLSEDKDDEIRAQVARALGWSNEFGADKFGTDYQGKLTKLLMDSNPRVQALATVPYSKLDDTQKQVRPSSEIATYLPLLKILKENNNKDVYTRQAMVHALATLPRNPQDLVNVWKQVQDQYDAPAVRLGVVLALRKLEAPQIEMFLNDIDVQVQSEVARAIYDLNIMKAMPALAKLAEKPNLPDAIAFRAIGANFKLGLQENANRVAEVAARSSEKDYIRTAALAMLSQWAKPKRLDIITGLTQDLGERSVDFARNAIQPVLAKLFVGSDAVRKEAVATTSKLGLKDVVPLMVKLVQDDTQTAPVRIDALYALQSLKANELKDLLGVVAKSKDASLRSASYIIGAKLDPQNAIKTLPALLENKQLSTIETQAVFQAMGSLPEAPAVDKLMAEMLANIAVVPAEVHLDLYEATEARINSKVKLHGKLNELLKGIRDQAQANEKKDHLANYRESLAGGDAARGRSIFLNNSAVYCQRCHKLDNEGGEVGPSMNGVAKDKNREYLLEAIVAPNKQIAKGFESISLTLIDGRIVTGVLRSKDAKSYTIINADNKVLVIPKNDVDAEKPDQSAMPADLVQKLSKREVRDLVEFLNGLKEVKK